MIPGTHQEPLHSTVRATRDPPHGRIPTDGDESQQLSGDREFGVTICDLALPEVPCHVCSSNPGDVVVCTPQAPPLAPCYRV